jgi:hypothetical protein
MKTIFTINCQTMTKYINTNIKTIITYGPMFPAWQQSLRCQITMYIALQSLDSIDSENQCASYQKGVCGQIQIVNRNTSTLQNV